jgi:hypothetical protein
VGSAAIGSHLARLFTGLWYDDSHRLAATVPIVAIPLATIGVLAAGEWLQLFFHRAASGAAAVARPALALALPLAVGAVVTVGTAAQSIPANATVLARHLNNNKLLNPAKLQFLQTVSHLVPASAVVADNPFDGTALLYAMSGTHVLFPQMNPGGNTAELNYLAYNLVHLDQNRRACDLVRRYHVDYMMIAPDYFLPGMGNPGSYVGVANPAGEPGFRLIASADRGQLSLYKITSCQPGSGAPAPVAAAGQGGG